MKTIRSKSHSLITYDFVSFSHLLLVLRFLWMIQLISLSKRLSNLTSPVPTKKENTVLHPFPLLPVYSPPTCISTVVRSTTGALAVTPRTHPSVMVSVSGSSLDAAQFLSTSQNQVTLSFATARCLPTLPSAMALTNNY